MLCVSPCATILWFPPSTAACGVYPWMKPSLVSSTRLSGSVKLRCVLGSGSFEGGRGTGPERFRVSRLAFLLLCAFGFGFRRRGSCSLPLKRLYSLAGFWPSASVLRRSSRAFSRRHGLYQRLCWLVSLEEIAKSGRC